MILFFRFRPISIFGCVTLALSLTILTILFFIFIASLAFFATAISVLFQLVPPAPAIATEVTPSLSWLVRLPSTILDPSLLRAVISPPVQL